MMKTVVILVVATLGLAPTAHADSTDDQYLAALNVWGVLYNDSSKMVSWGHAVCTTREAGYTADQVAGFISKDPSFTQPPEYADSLVRLATSYYCPKLLLAN